MTCIFYDININIIQHSHYQALPLILQIYFFDLKNDVKSIISQLLWNDMNIDKMIMSKHNDLQATLSGEFVFVDEYDKIKQAPGHISDDNDFDYSW